MEFAAFLNPLANPPAGQYRKFTDDDLAVLGHVRDLRTDGRTFGEIRDVLASMPPADRTAVTVDAIQPRQEATTGTAGEELAIVVSQAIRAELEAYRALLAQDAGKVARARWEGFSMGFTAAVLVVLATLGALALLVTWLGA